MVERFGSEWKLVDPYSEEDTKRAFSEPRKIDPSGYGLLAGKFCLVSTREVVTIGPNIAAQIVGKSSLARHGLIIESAGFLDSGFGGTVTLEVACLAGGVKLFAGMPIAQIVFHRLDTPTDAPYNGRYQNQRGPQISRYWSNPRPE